MQHNNLCYIFPPELERGLDRIISKQPLAQEIKIFHACQAPVVDFTNKNISSSELPWNLAYILIGRVIGSISTSILFSAFESWLVSAASAHALLQSDLSTIVGPATLVNDLVATGADVFSNKLVDFSGSLASLFIASGALLILAWVVIRGSWIENYGGTGKADVASVVSDPLQLARLRTALHIVSDDPRLLVLGLTQTCFEGSMYLFLFHWVPSLQEASLMGLLPLGYIFSSFMLSMMLGSIFYTFISISTETSLLTHAKLSSPVAPSPPSPSPSPSPSPTSASASGCSASLRPTPASTVLSRVCFVPRSSPTMQGHSKQPLPCPAQCICDCQSLDRRGQRTERGPHRELVDVGRLEHHDGCGDR